MRKVVFLQKLRICGLQKCYLTSEIQVPWKFKFCISCLLCVSGAGEKDVDVLKHFWVSETCCPHSGRGVPAGEAAGQPEGSGQLSGSSVAAQCDLCVQQLQIISFLMRNRFQTPWGWCESHSFFSSYMRRKIRFTRAWLSKPGSGFKLLFCCVFWMLSCIETALHATNLKHHLCRMCLSLLSMITRCLLPSFPASSLHFPSSGVRSADCPSAVQTDK